MATDLGKYRIIVDESQVVASQEDYYERTLKQYSKLANAIRTGLIESGFAPQSAADF